MAGYAARVQLDAAAKFSFGADRRLARRSEFEKILREGARRSLSGYTFYVMHRPDTGPPRLGLLVSRKHARQASQRNRIKRRIREAFRHEQAAFRGLDVLVRPPYDLRRAGSGFACLRKLFSRLDP